MNNEVILYHQLTHQRTISNGITHNRRKWQKNYTWFPIEQRRIYSHMDNIYKEVREKYGDALFREYAKERFLNQRIYSEVQLCNIDKEYYGHFDKLKPFMKEDSRLPCFYYEENCGKHSSC